MKQREMVELQITLDQAEILATLSKRLGYAEFRSIAESSEEAYRMGFAVAALRQSLAEQGIVVR